MNRNYMNQLFMFAILVILAVMLLMVQANPADGVNDAMEKVGQAASDAASAVGDAAKDAGKAVENAAKDAGDQLNKAADSAKEGLNKLGDQTSNLFNSASNTSLMSSIVLLMVLAKIFF